MTVGEKAQYSAHTDTPYRLINYACSAFPRSYQAAPTKKL